MPQTRPADALPRTGRITPEGLDLDDRARKVVRRVTGRAIVRQRLTPDAGAATNLHSLLRTDAASRGLTKAGRELIDLANAEADVAELREYEIFIHDLIDELEPACRRRTEAELDLADALADAEDEEVEARRAHDRTDPALHERQADAALRVAALAMERHGHHTRVARDLRAQKTTARARLGVSNGNGDTR